MWNMAELYGLTSSPRGSPRREGGPTSSVASVAAAAAALAASGGGEGESLPFVDEEGGVAESVKVLVRCRPLLKREYGYGMAAAIGDDKRTISVKKVVGGKVDAHETRVDVVLDAKATQADVYREVERFVTASLDGVNSTVFAYGQTGTGKTYSMLGQEIDLVREEGIIGGEGAGEEGSNPYERPSQIGDAVSSDFALTGLQRGIVPRAVEAIFERAEAEEHEAEYRVRCTYLQVYGNRVYDLLQPLPKEPLWQLPYNHPRRAAYSGREVLDDPVWGIRVQDVAPTTVSTKEEVFSLLRRGAEHRAMRQTLYNEHSSRSHSILQFQIEWRRRRSDGSVNPVGVRRGKLNLVDLAGSERWQPDVTSTREHIREMNDINESLSALSKVIVCLTKRQDHIPYRDSKLTRILSDSIGGNSRTMLLATISPSELNVEETSGTLRFADCAKRVMVRVRVNEEVNGKMLLVHYEKEIGRLKELLRSLTEGNEQSKLIELEKKNKTLKAELNKTKKDLRHTQGKLDVVYNAVEQERAEKERLLSEQAASTAATSPQKKRQPGLDSYTLMKPTVASQAQASVPQPLSPRRKGRADEEILERRASGVSATSTPHRSPAVTSKRRDAIGVDELSMMVERLESSGGNALAPRLRKKQEEEVRQLRQLIAAQEKLMRETGWADAWAHDSPRKMGSFGSPGARFEDTHRSPARTGSVGFVKQSNPSAVYTVSSSPSKRRPAKSDASTQAKIPRPGKGGITRSDPYALGVSSPKKSLQTRWEGNGGVPSSVERELNARKRTSVYRNAPLNTVAGKTKPSHGFSNGFPMGAFKDSAVGSPRKAVHPSHRVEEIGGEGKGEVEEAFVVREGEEAVAGGEGEVGEAAAVGEGVVAAVGGDS